VYGPGEQADRLLPSLQRAAVASTRVSLTAGDQLRDFTYVEDVAEGLLRLAAAETRPQAAIVHLATGRLTSVRTFAETAAAVFGIDPLRLDFGAMPKRPDEIRYGPVDIARLR